MISTVKSRPKFQVIEGGRTSEINYEEFKKDFIDPSTRTPELKKKYDMSKSEWKEYRQRVLDETGLVRKPTSDYHYNCILTNYSGYQNVEGNEYIQKVQHGWTVVKTINYETTYYGRYSSLECAKKVRDKLVESNWDSEVGEHLKLKYGRDRHKPAKHKALKLYKKFEWLYLYSDKPILDIKDELGLTAKMYGYLLKEMRKNHGNYRRPEMRKKYGVTTKVMKPNYKVSR